MSEQHEELSVHFVEKLSGILEMIRFSHTLFALPFALFAAVMAWSVSEPSSKFEIRHLFGILLCMVFARSAAMAFNRLVDRKVDAQNPRTAGRHLPSGRLSVQSVILFTIASSVGFFSSTFLFWPNPLPPILALPVLFFLLGYSSTKHFTSLAHYWLGAALMLAPISTWIAIRGAILVEFPTDVLPAVALGLAVLLWVGGFDIIYACQDFTFDSQVKLHSIPAKFGIQGALRVAALSHVGMITALVALPLTYHVGGPQLDLGWIYWTAIAAVALLLVYEHAIIHPDDLERVNTAFFNINSIISVGLFIVGSCDLLT